ncbi:hypothetical protein JG687_00018684 [Phytophthora cactorum]|uniref:Uncharacterized protein n=1 Tax=Phytophthora cactorum TaxID=29920 RepID=A0A8T1TND5_9STRA|nr:hypothetical protein JG687_00018684 [Phytophthora cactorum]
MIDAGIAHRRNDNILEKIKSLEASFMRAEDWRANTGQGITDEGDLKSARAKLCPYYDQLAHVMFERASTRPLYSSDALHDAGDIDSDSGAESEAENQPSSIGDSQSCVPIGFQTAIIGLSQGREFQRISDRHLNDKIYCVAI